MAPKRSSSHIIQSEAIKFTFYNHLSQRWLMKQVIKCEHEIAYKINGLNNYTSRAMQKGPLA